MVMTILSKVFFSKTASDVYKVGYDVIGILKRMAFFDTCCDSITLTYWDLFYPL